MRVKVGMLQSASVVASALALAQPALAQESAPAAPPAQAPQEQVAGADPSAGEDIVVTGLRRSVASAQAIKRNADQVVDAIVAEDIGKLPDVTASAALARVTGVQVNRGAGEAAQVQIRGLTDISTTYNGREIFTAENRFVAVQDFPAGGVAALEVYKSSTADLIEGGIGGQVNVRSRRPFDFDGFELSGAINGLVYEQSSQPDWNGSLLISDRFDTGIGEMGLLLNASMTNINFLDATRENDRFTDESTPGGFVRPNGQGIFYGSGDRWRPSVNAAFQWQATPELQVYVDGLFQGYRARDRNHWLFAPTFGNSVYSDVVLRDNGSAKSFTVTGATRPDGYDAFNDARTDTYQIAGGVNWKGERFKLTADVAYTDSTYTERNANIDYAFASSPARRVDFDVDRGQGGGVFEFLDFDPANPANYVFRGLFDRNYRAEGSDVQGRVDAEWETGLSWLPRLQFGLRYNDRDASRQNGQRYQALEERGILYADLPVQLAPIRRGFRYDDLQRQTVFPGATWNSVFDNVDALRSIAGFPTGTPPFNELEAFSANETALATYAQAKYAVDVGFPIDGTVGLRVIRTRTTVNGNSRDSSTGSDVFTPVSRQNEYVDYLPNASARLGFTDQLQLRLAFTQTRTRPGFDQLNPSRTFSPFPGVCVPTPTIPDSGPDNPNCIQDVNGGNPNLKPLRSNNYDASLEYYFSSTGSVTLGAFRRDTSNFIFRTTVDQVNPGAPDVRTNLPVNGGDGRIQGIEASFTSFLDIASLPDWAKGFGVQANYTYLDGKTELSPDLRERLPGLRPVPGLSKHAYNLVAFYEKPVFAARLAYNWRSDFVVEYQDIQGFLSPLYQDSLGTLDFTASVTPTKNVTVVFDMLNMLAQPIKTYRSYNAAGDSYRFQTRYLERVYSLGLRFRF